MKKLPFLFLFILINFTSAQHKKFIYEYQFIPDSTRRDETRTEMMILSVDVSKTEFYSFKKFSSDSTLLADSKKGIWSMPPNKEMLTDRIIKFSHSNTIQHITFMSWEMYNVEQNIDLKWKLENSFSKILNYEVQKATTHFGGRTWTAWFAKDIPINDGPYKFKNLPGLIVKIEDTQKNHIFELKGIISIDGEFTYPDLKNNSEFNLTYAQYVKKYRNYRQNPTADLVGKIPDQKDANGNFRSSSQIIKELNDTWLERLARDNNLIEIDLLQ